MKQHLIFVITIEIVILRLLIRFNSHIIRVFLIFCLLSSRCSLLRLGLFLITQILLSIHERVEVGTEMCSEAVFHSLLED